MDSKHIFVVLVMTNIFSGAQRYIVKPEDTLVLEGDSTQLNCTFDVVPNVKGWYMENSTVDILIALKDEIQRDKVTGDYNIIGDGNVYNLRVDNVTEDKEFLYDCADVAERKRIATAHLYVIEHLPGCGVSPGYQVTTYQDVTFTCEIELTEGAPGELVWLKNGEEINRVKNHTNILITRLDQSAHNATFDCQLQHKTLPPAKWSKISCQSKIVMDVQYPPSAVIDIETSNPIIEGREFRALCRSHGGNPSKIVSSYWIAPNGSRFSEEDTLVFENVTRYQGGEYTCIKANEFYDGKFGNATEVVYVDVQYLPKVMISVTPVPNAIEGTELEINCSSVNGNPEASMMTLSFEEDIVVEETWPDLSFLYTISSITANHAGTYKCIAITEFYDGSLQSSSDEQKIIVFYSPKITLTEDKFEANIGDVIDIKIYVDGFPKPELLWFDANNDAISANEENKQIMINHNSEQRFSSTLKVTVADETYYGIYTCEASNDVEPGVRVTMEIVSPGAISVAVIAGSSAGGLAFILGVIFVSCACHRKCCAKKDISDKDHNRDSRAANDQTTTDNRPDPIGVSHECDDINPYSESVDLKTLFKSQAVTPNEGISAAAIDQEDERSNVNPSQDIQGLYAISSKHKKYGPTTKAADKTTKDATELVLYAMPDKNRKKKKDELNYADLDLTTGSPQHPYKPTSGEKTIYADIQPTREQL